MKWLSNTYDPRKPDARWHVARMQGQTEQQAWEMHKMWLKDKIIGKPQATEAYTVEQLEDMGLVGVYENPTLSGKDAKDFIRSLLEQE